MPKIKLPFDKYAYYKRAVQSPDADVEFFSHVYKELKKRKAKTLREDFCGTFSISCEWVKLDPKHKAIAVDLDSEPLNYGRKHYLSRLKAEQQKRLQVLQKDILTPNLPRADIINASNFSFYFFKTRNEFARYLKSCLKHLNPGGILILDLFGGSHCHEPNEEQSSKGKFIYYWDQESFDPISNQAIFHIHFKPKGKRKYEKIFTYDWRMWNILEVREILADVGFRKTHVYWEGTNKRREGDGIFKRKEKGEECASWVAYIAAEK